MRVDVVVLQAEALDKVQGESVLVEVDHTLFVVVAPREMCAKKPLNDAHELDLDQPRQDTFELCFDQEK